MKKIIFLFVFFVHSMDAHMKTIGWNTALELFKSGELNPNHLAHTTYIIDEQKIKQFGESTNILLIDSLNQISSKKPDVLVQGFYAFYTKPSLNPVIVSMYDNPLPVKTVITELRERGAIGTPFTKELINRFPRRDGWNSPITNALCINYNSIVTNAILSSHQTFKAAVIAMLRSHNNITSNLTDIIVAYTNINAGYLTQYPNSVARQINQISCRDFISNCSEYNSNNNTLDPNHRPYLTDIESKLKVVHSFMRNRLLTRTPDTPAPTPHTRQNPPFYKTRQFRQVVTSSLILTPVIAANWSKS